MPLRTEQNWLGQWESYDPETYDGADDSRPIVGYGKTEDEAEEDYWRQIEEIEAEARDPDGYWKALAEYEEIIASRHGHFGVRVK